MCEKQSIIGWQYHGWVEGPGFVKASGGWSRQVEALDTIATMWLPIVIRGMQLRFMNQMERKRERERQTDRWQWETEGSDQRGDGGEDIRDVSYLGWFSLWKEEVESRQTLVKERKLADRGCKSSKIDCWRHFAVHIALLYPLKRSSLQHDAILWVVRSQPLSSSSSCAGWITLVHLWFWCGCSVAGHFLEACALLPFR